MLYLLWFVALAAAFAALAMSRALHAEYLVVLHWPRYGFFFFERTADGRHTGIGWQTLPGALSRFVVASSTELVRSVPRRTRAWIEAHVPFASGVKA
ncbi:MAG TPA: hypothetical protein VFI96_02770 [Longimicrobiaceae bacterium]|nr:hypothetical protein [Longimicrobiaceae bacterium]